MIPGERMWGTCMSMMRHMSTTRSTTFTLVAAAAVAHVHLLLASLASESCEELFTPMAPGKQSLRVDGMLHDTACALM